MEFTIVKRIHFPSGVETYNTRILAAKHTEDLILTSGGVGAETQQGAIIDGVFYPGRDTPNNRWVITNVANWIFHIQTKLVATPGVMDPELKEFGLDDDCRVKFSLKDSDPEVVILYSGKRNDYAYREVGRISHL